MSNEINYTYDHAGTRAVKSHGPMEAVYVNGAPQGINYHDEENYTVYVSPYMTVTADRYTKHYFSNSQRIASKLGTGEFDNVYGVNNFHLTAGQKDYAERMVQIEESRQEYMMENGIPPGVPTQKGQNIEPEITGAALPNKPLGNYDVPDGWPTPPHFNAPGDVPGPPLQWEEPEDLSNVEAGYGYKSDNTEETDIFFFHTDHLGSTSYLTDKDGNACEYVVYTPYGEALVNENNTDFENLYKFSGMELDKVTKLYNHGARQRDFWSTIWYGPDNLREQFPMYSPYSYCNGNPVKFVDPDGNKVVIKVSAEPVGTTSINLYSSGEVKSGIKQETMVVNVYPVTVENESGSSSVYYYTRIGYRKDANNIKLPAKEVTFDVRNDGDSFQGKIKSRWGGNNNVLELRSNDDINNQTLNARKGKYDAKRTAIQFHTKGATDGCLMSVGSAQFESTTDNIRLDLPSTSKAAQQAFMNDIINFIDEDVKNNKDNNIQVIFKQIYKDED